MSGASVVAIITEGWVGRFKPFFRRWGRLLSESESFFLYLLRLLLKAKVEKNIFYILDHANYKVFDSILNCFRTNNCFCLFYKISKHHLNSFCYWDLVIKYLKYKKSALSKRFSNRDRVKSLELPLSRLKHQQVRAPPRRRKLRNPIHILEKQPFKQAPGVHIDPAEPQYWIFIILLIKNIRIIILW